jgi:hypothetical protein
MEKISCRNFAYINTTKDVIIISSPVVNYNILGFKARNREETDVCIAFMHKKIWGIFALLIKPVKVIEVSLVSMGVELVIDMSAINFDMTFAKLLCFGKKQFEFN